MRSIAGSKKWAGVEKMGWGRKNELGAKKWAGLEKK
jgi:hypothetical protein